MAESNSFNGKRFLVTGGGGFLGSHLCKALAMAYHRVHGVSIRVTRIFNTYGPRMRTDNGRVVPNFCVQALRGEPLTVYGNGEQTRSFCYVDDLVAGLLKLFFAEHHEPVNLGNPAEYTILDSAKKIISPTASNSTIIHKPLPVDDPRVRCPDIFKARHFPGWEPLVSIDDGLKRTIDFFRDEERARQPCPHVPNDFIQGRADQTVRAPMHTFGTLK